MNTENNTAPLWRRLNEARTQGKWENSTNYIGVKKDRITHFVGGVTLTEAQDEINAQYTALAVNNLHILAEALEDTLREYNAACKLLAESTGMTWSENNISIKAKEALKAIS
jgi:hypothetical protein